MAVKRLLQIRPQLDDGNGVLASNYRLFFYAAGSSTKQNTYNSSTGGVANSNPIVLNARGEIAGEVWGTVGQTYKIGLAIPGSDDPPASFVWSEDNVSPINDLTSSLDEWVSGPAPTFISGTSFSLVGDQTTAFHVGRRIKTTNSGGTVYSTIITSAFAALTTITVVNDSGSLDAGLSAVSYGLQAATNPSEPLLVDTVPLRSGSADKTKKVRLEVDGLTTATTRVITVPDFDFTLGAVVQRGYAEYTTFTALSTVIPFDNTIPQNTEGTEILTATITPKSTSNRIRVRFQGYGSADAAQAIAVALFRDSVANALAANGITTIGASNRHVLVLEFEEAAPSTSAITYKIRVGPAANNFFFNGSAVARDFGGASRATLVVEEIS